MQKQLYSMYVAFTDVHMVLADMSGQLEQRNELHAQAEQRTGKILGHDSDSTHRRDLLQASMMMMMAASAGMAAADDLSPSRDMRDERGQGKAHQLHLLRSHDHVVARSIAMVALPGQDQEGPSSHILL